MIFLNDNGDLHAEHLLLGDVWTGKALGTGWFFQMKDCQFVVNRFGAKLPSVSEILSVYFVEKYAASKPSSCIRIAIPSYLDTVDIPDLSYCPVSDHTLTAVLKCLQLKKTYPVWISADLQSGALDWLWAGPHYESLYTHLITIDFTSKRQSSVIAEEVLVVPTKLYDPIGATRRINDRTEVEVVVHGPTIARRLMQRFNNDEWWRTRA